MKRKLTDLKPDEAVYVGTNKHAKKINKAVGGLFGCEKECFVFNEEGVIKWAFVSQDNIPDFNTIFKLKDFLAPKKSNRKMVKELREELTILKSKLYGIKTGVEIKTIEPFELEKHRIAAIMEVKTDIELEQTVNNPSIGFMYRDAAQKELNKRKEEQPFVLPEKWCVKFDSKLKFYIECFLDKTLFHDSGYFSYETNYPKAWIVSKYPAKNHTEITTEQFIEHVLKPSEKEPVKIEVGKWYKLTSGGLNFKGETHDYGFNSSGTWCYDNYWFNQNFGWLPATHSEVESALIAEAKRRGLVEGVRFISPDGEDHGYTLTSTTSGLGYTFQDNILCYGVYRIFNDGKWATMIEQPKEIDFSLAGSITEIQQMWYDVDRAISRYRVDKSQAVYEQVVLTVKEGRVIVQSKIDETKKIES